MLPESENIFNPTGSGTEDQMSVLAVLVTRKTGGPFEYGTDKQG